MMVIACVALAFVVLLFFVLFCVASCDASKWRDKAIDLDYEKRGIQSELDDMRFKVARQSDLIKRHESTIGEQCEKLRVIREAVVL